MKLATNNWNVREVGKEIPVSYYGYKTKREALAFMQSWNASHELQVEVVKYDVVNRKWIKC